VEVGISHRLYIDNNTFSKIDTDRFEALYSGYQNDTGERRTPGDLGTPSVIVPDYSLRLHISLHPFLS